MPTTYDRHSCCKPTDSYQTPLLVGERNELMFNPLNGTVRKNDYRLCDKDKPIVGKGEIIASWPGPMWGDTRTTTYRINVTLTA
jgi:hypothetical protein